METTGKQTIDHPAGGEGTLQPGTYAVLTVADTGIGIASEDLERIFEPFYSRKHMARSGSGLGLAVVWNTVQDHDGHIQVHSDEAGTRFELFFKTTGRKPVPEKEQPFASELQGNGERILVVDDESSVRELVRSMLQHLGYEAAAVGSGEEAILYLRSHEVDLVILDMIMASGMDGLETYQRIVAVRPGQKAIIASGYAENNRVKRALALGVGRFIRKPYTMEMLVRVLRDVLA